MSTLYLLMFWTILLPASCFLLLWLPTWLSCMGLLLLLNLSLFLRMQTDTVT